MSVDTVLSDTRQFIVRNFLVGGDDGKLSVESSLLGEGIMDSTGILELVSHLEQTYGISVLDEEMTADNLDSVAKIAAYVQRKVKG